jgi:cell division protein FtsL
MYNVRDEIVVLEKQTAKMQKRLQDTPGEIEELEINELKSLRMISESKYTGLKK